jgi:hypothetical protein
MDDGSQNGRLRAESRLFARSKERRMRQIITFGLACAVATATLISTPHAASPRVFFIEPKDGAEVANAFEVKFGLEGLELKPASDPAPDSGHHHLIIDGGPVPKGEKIPLSDKSLHFGKAQTSTQLTLSSGKHTLTMQFGDSGHISYGSDLSATITVNVK